MASLANSAHPRSLYRTNAIDFEAITFTETSNQIIKEVRLGVRRGGGRGERGEEAEVK